MLHARPAGLLHGGGAVVVADDEMFSPLQRAEQLGDALGRWSEGEIAEVPDLVVGGDRLVPALDDGPVHLANGRERPLVDAQARRVAEMRVAGEENCHAPLAAK